MLAARPFRNLAENLDPQAPGHRPQQRPASAYKCRSALPVAAFDRDRSLPPTSTNALHASRAGRAFSVGIRAGTIPTGDTPHWTDRDSDLIWFLATAFGPK